ncbi:hypothetical protein [Vibrio diazotrophicus]|uniref:hypothetical protein n=1 Tax=Vibrio diazotrophicus TaxID=685 RepID=UPI00142DCD10|nr:hypothetical protein [Vibrio diazotrophicus]NIY94568.1 hypothetical protein [Vibrio diazotrophicus]
MRLSIKNLHFVIRDVLYPLVLLMFSVLAALEISEFDVKAFESWLFGIGYFLAVSFTWRESNKRSRKVSWYISQEIESGNYVLSVWSSGWQKFWIYLSLTVFGVLLGMSINADYSAI